MIKKLANAVIAVSDIDQASTFCRDMLGLKVEMDFEAHHDEALDKLFGCPGVHFRAVHFEEGLKLLQFLSPTDGKPLKMRPWDIGATMLGMFVDDLEKTYSTLVERGVEFYSPIASPSAEVHLVGQVKAAHVCGPGGVRISLLEMPNP